jgi:hypothetical protein
MLSFGKFNLCIGIVISMLVTSSFVVAQQSSLYKFKEAGIQFVVPAGWAVEKNQDGSITVSAKDGDGYIVVAMTTFAPDASKLTADAQFKLFAEGSLSEVKKDWKGFAADEPVKATLSGLAMIAQSFVGTKDGVEMAGSAMLLGFEKPVGIFSVGTKKVSDKLNKDSGELFQSIKKIE